MLITSIMLALLWRFGCCNYEPQHHVAAALAQLRQRPGADAPGEPFSACPSWFLQVECDRCGKVQMVNQAHMRWDNMPIRDIIAVAEP